MCLLGYIRTDNAVHAKRIPLEAQSVATGHRLKARQIPIPSRDRYNEEKNAICDFRFVISRVGVISFECRPIYDFEMKRITMDTILIILNYL